MPSFSDAAHFRLALDGSVGRWSLLNHGDDAAVGAATVARDSGVRRSRGPCRVLKSELLTDSREPEFRSFLQTASYAETMLYTWFSLQNHDRNFLASS